MDGLGVYYTQAIQRLSMRGANMPRGDRLLIKRNIESIRKHTASIHLYLTDLESKFREVHPDIADAFQLADALDAELDKFIISIDEQI